MKREWNEVSSVDILPTNQSVNNAVVITVNV